MWLCVTIGLAVLFAVVAAAGVAWMCRLRRRQKALEARLARRREKQKIEDYRKALEARLTRRREKQRVENYSDEKRPHPEEVKMTNATPRSVVETKARQPELLRQQEFVLSLGATDAEGACSQRKVIGKENVTSILDHDLLQQQAMCGFIEEDNYGG